MTVEAGRENGPKSGENGAGTGVSGAQFAGAGFQFTAYVLLSVWAGIWLDRKLGTSPWLLIVTVFVGTTLGFYSLYRNLMKGTRLSEQQKEIERRKEAE